METATTEAMSPMRTLMTAQMEIRGLSENTKTAYIREVSALSRHYGRCPSNLEPDEVRKYVHDRINSGLAPRSTNVTVAALKVFYADTLDRPGMVSGLRSRKTPDRLPRTIPEEDVQRLVLAIPDLRYRTATLTAYGCGLRISEVVALKAEDILSDKGVVHVASGKGGHERMAPLPEGVLAALRRYWKNILPRPETWMFYGSSPDRPISDDALRNAFNAARDRLGMGKHVTFHCLRHAVATHLHEHGAPLSTVQDVLGHKKSESTLVYARATGKVFRKLRHPVDGIRTG